MFFIKKSLNNAFNLKKKIRTAYPTFFVRSPFLKKIKTIRGFSKLSGCGLQGKKTIFSKSSWLIKPKFHYRDLKKSGQYSLFFVISFVPRLANLTHSAVLKSSLGGYTLAVATQFLSLFSFCRSTPNSLVSSKSIWAQKSWWWVLKLLSPHTNISQIPLFSLYKTTGSYAAAAGSSSFFIIGGLWGSWAFLLLPSGQPKFLPDSFIVSLGSAHPCILSRKSIILAGHNRRFGKKPQVRGTVKNANDHPNGGRTRSLRFSQTPWAKPAKKSRKQKLISKFKPLSKRSLKKKPEL